MLICPLSSCPVGKLWKWNAYFMEMDDVLMKDECLKGGHAEKLITPLLSGPNTCYPFPGISVSVCAWTMCVCVCVCVERKQKKKRPRQ